MHPPRWALRLRWRWHRCGRDGEQCRTRALRRPRIEALRRDPVGNGRDHGLPHYRPRGQRAARLGLW